MALPQDKSTIIADDPINVDLDGGIRSLENALEDIAEEAAAIGNDTSKKATIRRNDLRAAYRRIQKEIESRGYAAKDPARYRASHELNVWEQPTPNPIAAALEHVVEQEEVKADDIKTKLDNLKSQRAKCLPVEGELIKKLDAQIRLAEEEYALHSSKREDLGFKRIDLRVPLAWRNKDRMPKLAIFSLDKPTMKIQRANWNRDPVEGITAVLAAAWVVAAAVCAFVARPFAPAMMWLGASLMLVGLPFAIHYVVVRATNGVFPKRTLPKHLIKYYTHDSGSYLSSSRGTFSIETSFAAGQIPDDVKAKIEEACKQFGRKNVFLVAEATWTRSDRPAKPRLDPMVIAVKKEVTYMVANFDLTPLEEAISEEFSF